MENKRINKPMYKTRVYKIWSNMIQRCTNEKNTHFSYYGGKGIKICEEWKSSKNFVKWSYENGYQEHLTIDRINSNGNYEPSNCRWITRKEQSQNLKNNRNIEIKGVCKSVSQWAEYSGINKNTLTKRLNNGWNNDELLKPIDRRFHVKKSRKSI